MDNKTDEKQQESPQHEDPQQDLADVPIHHQTRDSGTNWAEFDVNAAPQVAVYDAPESMAPPGVDVEADQHRRSSSDEKPTTVVTIPWYKKAWVIALPIVLVSIIAIVIPVAITQSSNRVADDGGNDPAIPSVTSSDVSSVSLSSTLTTRRPASTSTVTPECNSSQFVRGVNWIGSSIPNWSFKLDLADDAVDCCEQCYQDQACNGWMYMADDASTVPPCNRILGHTGPNPSDDCPNGKPDIVFAKGSNSLDNFGGGGPCGGRVRS
ncbi:hypothetical protein B0T11DRAFT_330444 [Plectosphaerella cucumerina]|uniref:Uncharacterized protein n=1 Tax=Plectosphaerella cucumerina TaxID=40658 RepID=A0A8K0TBS1_9PEZI|nr:hypothetical protein B0T11DRAFT_330444 [Plectosphaerella cucumerina]